MPILFDHPWSAGVQAGFHQGVDVGASGAMQRMGADYDRRDLNQRQAFDREMTGVDIGYRQQRDDARLAFDLEKMDLNQQNVDARLGLDQTRLALAEQDRAARRLMAQQRIDLAERGLQLRQKIADTNAKKQGQTTLPGTKRTQADRDALTIAQLAPAEAVRGALGPLFDAPGDPLGWQPGQIAAAGRLLGSINSMADATDETGRPVWTIAEIKQRYDELAAANVPAQHLEPMRRRVEQEMQALDAAYNDVLSMLDPGDPAFASAMQQLAANMGISEDQLADLIEMLTDQGV